jgi:hypothetical protein
MTKRIIGIDLAVSAAHKAMVFDPACAQFIGGQITFRARPDDLERLLRRALWKHTGSDQIDSRVLALLYQIAPQRLSRCPLPKSDLLALQRACRAYVRWREQDVAMQNRIQAIDRWAWDGLQKLVPAEAQSWLRQRWYNPWRVQAAGEAALTAAWTAAAADQEVATDWIARWVARAEQMTRLYGSEEMVGYDQLQQTLCQA